MLIQINTNIVATTLGLILDQNFHLQMGADMSPSLYIDNNNKDILILDEASKQGLDDNTLTAEAKYPIKFTQPRKRLKSSLHHNGNNGFLFVNATNICQFKAKVSEIKDYTL